LSGKQQTPLQRVIDQLKHLPGIGPRTAQRLAFYLLKMPNREVQQLAKTISELKEQLHFCSACQNLTEESLCSICKNSKREQSKILVVEEPSTLYAMERTGGYNGLYHVLHGSLSPLDGRGPADLRVQGLLDRIKKGGVKEVIMATNPTIEGETTAIYLARLVRPMGVFVSRIAYGIPVGMDLEYADEVTLIKSLEGRREL
jgi:recombination protein RecR